MPKFTFTSPDGKRYTVNGPEGATQEQAFSILQEQLGGAPAPAQMSAQQAINAIPGATPDQLARSARGTTQEQSDNLFGKAVSPVDAALSIGSGMLATPIGAAAGIGRALTSGKFGTQEGVREGEQFGRKVTKALSHKPATATARDIVETVGEVTAPLAALPSVGAADLAALSRSAAPAARAAGDMARAGGSRLAEMASNVRVTPKIDKQTASLAKLAQEKYDIPLRPDQLYDNRITRMAGEASEKVPLGGSKADVRQEAFNKAVIRTIGGDEAATRLTPDVFDKAIRTSGQKIGDIAARHPLPLDQKLSGALDSHVVNAAKYETADVGRVVTSYIDDLRSKAVDGVIPGEAVRKINTAINNRMRTTADGDLKNALAQLQDDIQDALQKQLSGEDLSALRSARQQYAAAKTVEPLVAKSAVGDISPAGLMGRVTANNAGKTRMARGKGGELGELARIGQRFLKEPASSGTAERSLTYGLLGGGLVVEPATAASVISLANIYNRAGPAVARKLSGASKSQRTTLAELAREGN